MTLLGKALTIEKVHKYLDDKILKWVIVSLGGLGLLVVSVVNAILTFTKHMSFVDVNWIFMVVIFIGTLLIFLGLALENRLANR